MNKYLRKIIDEYFNYELKFKDELLEYTCRLLDDYNNDWYYYDTYTVFSENNDMTTEKGYIVNQSFKMRKRGKY